MPAIEITAHDIETAINQGLSRLQLLRAEVKIEVLDEGSRGVLGIGARQARVRLTPYAEVEAAGPVSNGPSPEDRQFEAAEPDRDDVDEVGDDEYEGEFEDDLEDDLEDEIEDTAEDEPYDETDEALGAARGEIAPADAELEFGASSALAAGERELDESDAQLAAQLTQGVLDRMSFRTTCAGRLVQPADDKESAHIWVAIEGEDASRLLAHQSESLEALQLVVQNMWAHRTKTGIRITLDADQYKANREHRIKQMATRLAERAVSTGRSITLEPMPPAERRLVHLALRDHPQVYTESEGEGNQRRITIKLKR